MHSESASVGPFRSQPPSRATRDMTAPTSLTLVMERRSGPAGRPGDWPGDPMASTRIFAGFVLGVRPIGATGGRAAALGTARRADQRTGGGRQRSDNKQNTTQHTHTTAAGGAPTRRLRNETRRMRSNNCTVTRHADTGRKPAASERFRPPARLADTRPC